MRAHALLVCALLAAPAAGQGKTKGAPPAPSGAEEVYRLGREALGRGAFDAAARLFRALEDDASISATPGYAFNRAQAARFLANAGEAVYWYGRYLSLSPGAADAATVRDLTAKLTASYPKSVRGEAHSRARAEWERALADFELERALRACPEARLDVRFAREGVVLGGTAFVYPARIVFWDLPGGDAPGTIWVVPTAPVAPPEELGGPPLLLLPPGRAFALEVGPELVSPAVTLAPPAPVGFAPDPALAAWRVELRARWERDGPPILLVARRTAEALTELRSGPTDGFVTLGKKRRDAPSEPVPLLFGPRAARPDKNAPKGLLAAVALPGKEGTLDLWGAPLSLFDVANRFGRLTVEGAASRFWVRGETTGPSLLSLAK